MNPVGTHILIDLFEAADPGDRAEELLRKVAEKAGCKVIGDVNHLFEGGGRTVLLLLSTSHASIHTWPEAGYVAVDLYSCGELEQLVVDEVLDLVKEYVPSKRQTVEVRIRGRDLSS